MKLSGIYRLLCLLAVVAVLLPSCRKARRIPEEVLQEIITESLITDAIIREENRRIRSGQKIFSDSLDYYKPIAEKYGYTMEDVRHTIEYMATRRSNPMKNVLDMAIQNIDKHKQRASVLYQGTLKFDSLAIQHYTDTVYHKDTTTRGTLKDYKIFISSPKKGEYTLTFYYQTVEDYKVRTKSVKYRLASPPADSVPPAIGTFWMNRNPRGGNFRNMVQVHQPVYDSLNFWFSEPVQAKDYKGADTSMIRDIMIIYAPTVQDARSDFMYEMTGFGKPLEEIYEKLYYPADSMPTPSLPGR